MVEKTELIVCLGSSCFARGNKKIIHAIQSYIENNNLSDRVVLRGGHCFGQCTKGPVLKINNRFFENVNHLDVIDILDKEFSEETF
jgi:NADH:ubiquinone oxidoreductase subunit E